MRKSVYRYFDFAKTPHYFLMMIPLSFLQNGFTDSFISYRLGSNFVTQSMNQRLWNQLCLVASYFDEKVGTNRFQMCTYKAVYGIRMLLLLYENANVYPGH